MGLLLLRSSVLDLSLERPNSCVIDCSVFTVSPTPGVTFGQDFSGLTDLVKEHRINFDVRALRLPGPCSIGRLLELGRYEAIWFFVSKSSETECFVGGFHVSVTKRDGLEGSRDSSIWDCPQSLNQPLSAYSEMYVRGSQIRHDGWRSADKVRRKTVQSVIVELPNTSSVKPPDVQPLAISAYLFATRRRQIIDSVEIPVGDLIGCDTHTLPLSVVLAIMLLIVELVQHRVVSGCLRDEGLGESKSAARSEQ